jgi:hypothetical protein
LLIHEIKIRLNFDFKIIEKDKINLTLTPKVKMVKLMLNDYL